MRLPPPADQPQGARHQSGDPTVIELDEQALTAAHVAVEDVLIEFRDERISVLGPANGFVIKERDGSLSEVMRLGTRDGLAIGIKAYLAACMGLPSPAEPGPLPQGPAAGQTT